MKRIICIIGRGHSGTRMIAEVLKINNIPIGNVINGSNDKEPFKPIYQNMFRYMEEHFQAPITNDEFIKSRIDEYLKDLYEYNEEIVACKLPELVFSYPHLNHYYPDVYFIVWWRSPLANKKHGSTDFIPLKYNIISEEERIITSRAFSWKIQYDIIKSVTPNNIIEMKYEDYILDPAKECKRLSNFLGVEIIHNIKIKQNVDISYKDSIIYKYLNTDLSFLKEPMKDLKYL